MGALGGFDSALVPDVGECAKECRPKAADPFQESQR